MTMETHRAGGMLVSLVGFEFLRQKGLLLNDVNQGLQWLVIYPFCMWGSTASDLDHHWGSCPSKGYPDWLINKALHITKPIRKFFENNKKSKGYKVADTLCANHRSYHTHSDWTLFLMMFLLYSVMNHKITLFGTVDTAILLLVLTGITMGIIAHFILDMLTPDGVWIMEFVILNKLLGWKLPKKLRFVPKSSKFATDGDWEKFVCKVLKFMTAVALAWFLINLCFPDLNIFQYLEWRQSI